VVIIIAKEAEHDVTHFVRKNAEAAWLVEVRVNNDPLLPVAGAAKSGESAEGG
jgi:hypothetical protein